VQRPDGLETSENSSKLALANLIIATGAQCSMPTSAALKVQKSYFALGKRQAFTNMLEDMNLDVVRAFLLMAFYMLGAARRNAAFLYLIVATQAAVTLGLHSNNSYHFLAPGEHQKRYQSQVCYFRYYC
jgi:hypothetical protein